jgi:hypothetical protein
MNEQLHEREGERTNYRHAEPRHKEPLTAPLRFYEVHTSEENRRDAVDNRGSNLEASVFVSVDHLCCKVEVCDASKDRTDPGFSRKHRDAKRGERHDAVHIRP